MSDRVGLIERAAALLRNGEAPGAPPAPRSGFTTPRPLTRTMALDRGQLARSGISLPDTASNRIVEEFRIIKRNIMVGWQSSENLREVGISSRIIMITSARPREGKTFSSVNLALAFASEHNLAVVLIDADTMRKGIARSLGTPSEPGLTEVLAGQIELADALIQTDIPNLIVLPCGASDSRTPELLASRATSILFSQLAERYPDHVILLDSPPCLASSDPASLASMVGQIIFVIEAGHTQQEEIESSLSLISSCTRISLLLNKSEARTSEHFGAYSYYYKPEDKKNGDRAET